MRVLSPDNPAHSVGVAGPRLADSMRASRWPRVVSPAAVGGGPMERTLARMLRFALLVTAVSAAPLSEAAAQTTPKPTDAELKDRVEHRLETSDVVGKYDIKVKVDGGVATLSGDVATAPQKTAAARLATVTGITKVENNITVNPDADKTVAERAKNGLT